MDFVERKVDEKRQESFEGTSMYMLGSLDGRHVAMHKIWSIAQYMNHQTSLQKAVRRKALVALWASAVAHLRASAEGTSRTGNACSPLFLYIL